MRELRADLELCNMATPGPWAVVNCIDVGFSEEICALDCDDTIVISASKTESHDADAAFIAAARTGWLETIERAMKLETENDKARELIARAIDENKLSLGLTREFIDFLFPKRE